MTDLKSRKTKELDTGVGSFGPDVFLTPSGFETPGYSDLVVWWLSGVQSAIWKLTPRYLSRSFAKKIRHFM